MKTFGVVISSEKLNEGWGGLWFCKGDKLNVDQYCGVVRETKEEAEQDAVLLAKEYANDHGIMFISEGYLL